jgi:hypothetical protein
MSAASAATTSRSVGERDCQIPRSRALMTRAP